MVCMPSLGYFVNFLMTIILIVGGYQFYFLVQRRHRGEPTEFRSTIEGLIPFRPGWVWIYSGLYYPVIVSLVFTIDSFAQFNYTAFSFILLLAMQIVLFFFFPVKIPEYWRNYDRTASLSTRFLALVHSYDGLPNSIPSMHVSVSTLAALHLCQNLAHDIGYLAQLAFLFPILIAISSLFTKQHYIVDLPPGALLGFLNFEIYNYIRTM
jgi:membrane-associated phospholipid phosphatase